jgi:integrase/recombinase XerD
MMNQLRLRINRLIETNAIGDATEREKLKYILSNKRFNPYCLLHSSISRDSDFLPDYALKKEVRWSMNSKQPSRYIKSRMGNDLKQKILLQNGIISDIAAKPNPSISECPRCNLVNAIENKFCSSCGYPLTPLAFQEIKEVEDKKLIEIERKQSEEMEYFRQRLGCIENILLTIQPLLRHVKPEILSKLEINQINALI